LQEYKISQREEKYKPEVTKKALWIFEQAGAFYVSFRVEQVVKSKRQKINLRNHPDKFWV